MAVSVSCPTCSTGMESGWLAMWNPILGQKIRWQATKPGWARLRVPKGAAVVLKTRTRGRDARAAYRCPDCATVVVPPDESYDGPEPTSPAADS